jgi:hypothetical protein
MLQERESSRPLASGSDQAKGSRQGQAECSAVPAAGGVRKGVRRRAIRQRPRPACP